MKGDKKIIEYLNTILKNELTAINQYFLHSRILEDWGINKLSKILHEESVDEMRHADVLIKRILFLEGLPNLQSLNKLNIGEDIEEIIACDLKLEEKGLDDLRNAIKECETKNDYVTRDIFNKILIDEEGHVDWLETQQTLIKKLGVERYLLLQSESASE